MSTEMLPARRPAAVPGPAVTELRTTLARFGAVSLDEVEAKAALQVRNDRKYLIPPGSVASLLEAAADIERPRVLEIDGDRVFRYESLYFDSASLVNYFDAAYGRPRRRKVRTRSYVDADTCMLEVKERDSRGRTVKHRLPYAVRDRGELTAAAHEFVAGMGVPKVEELAPVLASRYRRATLLFEQCGVRVTVDVDLAWCDGDEHRLAPAGLVVVETKSATQSSAIDRMLWRRGHRPVAISKYCTGLAALRPDLPANRWHRTLQRIAALPGSGPA